MLAAISLTLVAQLGDVANGAAVSQIFAASTTSTRPPVDPKPFLMAANTPWVMATETAKFLHTRREMLREKHMEPPVNASWEALKIKNTKKGGKLLFVTDILVLLMARLNSFPLLVER